MGRAGIGSNVGDEEGLWKKIRGLNFPSKISLFLWRVLHGILPLKEILVRRNLAREDGCPVCKDSCETIEHALFECEAAQRVWRVSRLGLVFSVGGPMRVGEWLVRWWKEVPNKGILVESFAILWIIWCRRNKFVLRHFQDPPLVCVSEVGQLSATMLKLLRQRCDGSVVGPAMGNVEGHASAVSHGNGRNGSKKRVVLNGSGSNEGGCTKLLWMVHVAGVNSGERWPGGVEEGPNWIGKERLLWVLFRHSWQWHWLLFVL